MANRSWDPRPVPDCERNKQGGHNWIPLIPTAGEVVKMALGVALGEALGEALDAALGEVLGEALGAALGEVLGGALGVAPGATLNRPISHPLTKYMVRG